jgi:hypothetical protein
MVPLGAILNAVQFRPLALCLKRVVIFNSVSLAKRAHDMRITRMRMPPWHALSHKSCALIAHLTWQYITIRATAQPPLPVHTSTNTRAPAAGDEGRVSSKKFTPKLAPPVFERFKPLANRDAINEQSLWSYLAETPTHTHPPTDTTDPTTFF